MKSEKDSAVAKTAYNKTLPTPIEYHFSWSEYESFDEVVMAKDELTNDEVVKVRNTERKAKARQASLTKALDDNKIEKPSIENDPMLRLRRMYDLFIANGASHEEAREKSALNLGLQWDSE